MHERAVLDHASATFRRIKWGGLHRFVAPDWQKTSRLWIAWFCQVIVGKPGLYGFIVMVEAFRLFTRIAKEISIVELFLPCSGWVCVEL